MCGIVGFVGDGDEGDLKGMVASVAHRGPDANGYVHKDNVGLGHARLSIIDLSSSGSQPMFNKKRDVAVIFNGEIYNFKALKGELVGYKWKSDGDTEVILAAYEAWGSDCFSHLEGMFAIAIYDFRESQLLLARDRMGKKPLYWSHSGNTLLFASELKSLHQHHIFSKRLDMTSLRQYLFYESVPTPRSIWEGVEKLEPGSVLVYDSKGLVREKFWSFTFKRADLSYAEASSRLDTLLGASVEERLMSDVPLGVFLSGGLDSSAIAYYAQEALKRSGEARVQTFSIGFSDKSFDESSYARQVAEHLGTDHHERIVSAEDMLSVIPHLPDVLDEPVADVSIVPTYLLSEFAKEYVSVALGGDGGDELFFGYQTFQAEALARYFLLLPEVVRKRLVTPLVAALPGGKGYFSALFNLKQAMRGLGSEVDIDMRHACWLASFLPSEIDELMVAGSRTVSHGLILEPAIQAAEEAGTKDWPSQVTAYYMRRYLMDNVLVKVDRASMAHGLEVRAPLLDTRVVELANSMDPRYKVRGLKTKRILKDLMMDRLPEGIAGRKKHGFSVPLSDWLRGPLRPMMTDLLASDRVSAQGIFDPGTVNKLVESHLSAKRDNRKPLWTLLVFQLWHDRWMKR